MAAVPAETSPSCLQVPLRHLLLSLSSYQSDVAMNSGARSQRAVRKLRVHYDHNASNHGT